MEATKITVHAGSDHPVKVRHARNIDGRNVCPAVIISPGQSRDFGVALGTHLIVRDMPKAEGA